MFLHNWGPELQTLVSKNARQFLTKLGRSHLPASQPPPWMHCIKIANTNKQKWCLRYIDQWRIYHPASFSSMSGHNPGSDRCLWAVSSIFIVSPQNRQRTLFPLWISILDFENQVSYHVFMLLDNGELLSQFRMRMAKVPSSCCDCRPIASAWLFPKAGVDNAWWYS